MPGRPHTLWSRLVLLLERAWVKTGHKPGASSRSEGPCAPCAHCSLNRALARRQLASSAPDKNQLQQIARSAARCSRARVGARAPRLQQIARSAARCPRARVGARVPRLRGETAATAHLAELRFWARLCTHSAPRGPEPRLCSSTADARRSQQLSESHANLPLLIPQEQERCPKPNR